MTGAPSLTVDVVSDVVCPWCYLGRARLLKAMEAVPETPVEIHWRPFQLDPTLPAGGRDRKTYLADKFGDGGRIGEAHAQLAALGRDAGIAFDFDAIAVSPNTLDAHRVIRWAAGAGDAAQDRLVGRLFSLYFEQGENIGDRRVLIDAAHHAGMDKALVETLLAAGADRAEVEQEIATARRMGINGVPCFLIEGRYAVMGAQEASVLADAIARIAAAKAEGRLDPPGD